MHEGTLLYGVTFLHEDTFVRRQFCTMSHFCLKTFLHGGSILHEDTFAQVE